MGLTVKRHMGIFFVLIVVVVTTVYSWPTSKLSCLWEIIRAEDLIKIITLRV